MRAWELKSIGVKLFLLTSYLVIMTVIGTAWQNALLFSDYIQRQTDEATLALAKDSSAELTRQLLQWRTQLTALRSAYQPRQPTSKRRAMLHDFLATHSGAVAVYAAWPAPTGPLANDLVLAGGGAGAPGGQQSLQPFLAAAPELLPPSLILAAKDRSRRSLRILSLVFPGHPALLAVLLPGTGDAPALTVVLRPEQLTGSLPQHRLARTRLLAANGAELATLHPRVAMPMPAALAEQLAQDVSLSEKHLGSQVLTSGGDEPRSWLTAFAKNKEFGTTVLIERTMEGHDFAVESLVRRSALWGWIFVLIAVGLSVIGASSVTAKLRHLTLATQEIARGNLRTAVAVRGGDEVALLGEAVGDMAQRIGTLLGAEVTKAVMEKELETAQAVQRLLLTQSAPTCSLLSRLHVAGFTQPATQCGGDWWGRFTCANGSDVICIGDAAGHGVPAALVSAMAFACVQTAMQDDRPDMPFSPARLLRRFNDVLWASVGGSVNMTFFVAHLDSRAQRVTYANAGHVFPLQVLRQPDDHRYAKRATSSGSPKPLLLAQAGIPVGLRADGEYTDLQLPWLPGDKVIFYTDGLLDCTDASGEPWGRRRFVSLLNSAAGMDAGATLAAVQTAALNHFGLAPLADDVTLVVASYGESVAATTDLQEAS